MTSLLKTMEKFRPSRTRQNIYQSKGNDKISFRKRYRETKGDASDFLKKILLCNSHPTCKSTFKHADAVLEQDCRIHVGLTYSNQKIVPRINIILLYCFC